MKTKQKLWNSYVTLSQRRSDHNTSKCGATVPWSIDKYLQEATNKPNNKVFYFKPPSNLFADHQDTIINSLNDIVWKNLIDKETSEILKSSNVKPAHFYMRLKIHKMNNPGRSVISSIKCHTTKLSKYIDHFIKPLAKEVKSNICDLMTSKTKSTASKSYKMWF